jgi:hypothetical protein
MTATKLHIKSDAAIPLIARLPYAVAISDCQGEASFDYNPGSQLTVFAGGRDFSTCREDESVNPLFGRSKADTKKDD